jgi:hypothetical protein
VQFSTDFSCRSENIKTQEKLAKLNIGNNTLKGLTSTQSEIGITPKQFKRLYRAGLSLSQENFKTSYDGSFQPSLKTFADALRWSMDHCEKCVLI